MLSFLRLQPFRSLAFRLIDANLFRHALEERLKREYIVMEAAPGAPAIPALPTELGAHRAAAAEEQAVEFPVPAVRQAATGG